MNAQELQARSIRARGTAEIDRDIQNACAFLGAIAAGSQLTGRPMDHNIVQTQLTGLQSLLWELRHPTPGQHAFQPAVDHR